MADEIEAQVDAVLDVLAPAPPPGVVGSGERAPIILLHTAGQAWPAPPDAAQLQDLARRIVTAVRAAASPELPAVLDPAPGDKPGQPLRVRLADGTQADFTSLPAAAVAFNHADGAAGLYQRQAPTGVWVRTQVKAA